MTLAEGQSRTGETQGALRDVSVLEFGQYIPGPLLGMLLADQGAEVIKVERPEGDPARRHPAFATWNRGKRSVLLDLKSSEGQRKAQLLAQRADVVIENFRPGVADRLGIGYERVRELNPQVVYCSLPGYGEGSPQRDEPGWDPVIGSATGLHQPLDGNEEPLFTPLPLPSTFAAIVAAGSIALALCARDNGKGGQRIEVPLHNAMFTAMGSRIIKFHDYEYQDEFIFPRHVMSHQYQCSDGRWVQHHGMFERFARQTLTAAGHPEWIEEAASLFGSDVDREALDVWRKRFEDMFRQRTAREWEDAINAQGGACTVCKTVDEWLVHEHAVEAKMVAEVEDANYGTMKQPGVQVRLRGTPGAVQGRAPLLGEHTEEVLAGLESAPPRVPAVPARAAAEGLGILDGVRVLDFCLILAGPTCGRTLGEYGADVIKIDDPTRPTDPVGYMDVNRGKRSISVNLRTEEGQAVVWRLIDSADVIVQNNRKGSLARLGLSYEDVVRRNPNIIYASLNAFGYDGPWSERAGWEQLAQATSGIQVRRGGRDGAPLLLPYAANDYGTGMMGAYAVALALHERNRTGRGQSVDSGLALTAGLLQCPYFLDYEGFRREEPEGLGVRGYSALSRLYQATDGWVYIHCPNGDAWGRMTGLPEFSSLSEFGFGLGSSGANGQDGELASALGRIVATAPCEHWVEALKGSGVGVTRNLGPAEFRDDAYVRDAGLIVTREQPGWGRVDHVGNTARLSETPMRVGKPTPVMGADTDEILGEAGYSDGEIAALKAAGAVVSASG